MPVADAINHNGVLKLNFENRYNMMDERQVLMISKRLKPSICVALFWINFDKKIPKAMGATSKPDCTGE